MEKLLIVILVIIVYISILTIINSNDMGYGHCLHCKDTWKTKEGHTIQFSEHSGMFPLCEECYKILPPEKIFTYIERQLDLWEKYDKKMNREEIYKNACDFVVKEKTFNPKGDSK